MKSWRLVCSLLAVLNLAASASGAIQTPLDAALGTVEFQQRLGQRVSLDLPFRDESGQSVILKRYFNGRPVLLVPGYYGCPMLCRLLATGLSNALRDLPLTAGKDFEVVFFSVDPQENAALAAEKKSYLRVYQRPGAEAGWHFLTGDSPASRQLADEIGFHYYYDPASKQFAHPSGLVILTPDGAVSHYLFGVSFSVNDLHAALADAAVGRVGSALRRLALLCFHYQPLTGRYAGAALLTVRLTALGLLGVLAAWIISALRREKSPTAKPTG